MNDARAQATQDRPRMAVTFDETAASPLDLKTTLGAICDLVWVVDLGAEPVAAMERALRRFGTVVETTDRTVDDVAAELAGLGVRGVVSFCDPQLALAAGLARRLGLPGNPPEVVGRLTDKFAQRTALRAAGLACPGFVSLPAGVVPADAVAALGGLRYPLVLKPLRGASSRGVALVADPASAEAWFAERAGAVGSIAEELLAGRPRTDERGDIGDYVSVEVVVQDGVAVPVATTGKFTIAERFRERGNFMPHQLDADDAAAVLALAVDAAAALGVRSGALHVELKLTPDGPVVIEVNGRVGGGAIDDLYARRAGRSLTELAARVALGEPLELTAEAPARHDGPFHYEHFVQPPVGAERFVIADGAGDLVGVSGVESVGLHLSPGDPIDWSIGSLSFVLRATGTAADVDELAKVPATVAEVAAIRYE